MLHTNCVSTSSLKLACFQTRRAEKESRANALRKEGIFGRIGLDGVESQTLSEGHMLDKY